MKLAQGGFEVEIRVATMEDIDQIALLFIEQFDVQAVLDPYLMQSGTQSEEFIKNTIKDADSQLFVAEEVNKIVGFVTVFEKKNPDFDFMIPHKYVHLMDIIVTKGHQGKGIANRLMDEVKKWALDRKLDYIELTVAANNSAVNFYLKNGYEETMKTMRYQL